MALELPTLQEELKSIAVAASGLLAGTAVYISVVEVKSRAKLDIKSMRKQWSDSFDNAAVFVLGVGTVNTTANVALFFMDTSPYKNLWLVEPCLFIIGGIYTSIVMLPEIRELKNDELVAKKGDKWVEEGINRWSKRHLLRTLINLCGSCCVIYTAIKSH
ncbi:unnamed protein product [Mytilus coruscus]|uniref:DUF1772 domain-containing protein n=1 Tax=Mytilus coruscus TaxID=42192 RepID=A0A6J8BNN4_MYTCO|nr:unnamed protein product [Mytilus coruscus]